MIGLEVCFVVAVACACLGAWVRVGERTPVRDSEYAHRYLDLAERTADRALRMDLEVLARLHTAAAVRRHRRPHRTVGTVAALALTGVLLGTPVWWSLHPGELVGWSGALWTGVLIALVVEAPAAWAYVASLPRERGIREELDDYPPPGRAGEPQ